MDSNVRPPDRSALKYVILIAVMMAIIICIIVFMWRTRDPEDTISPARLGPGLLNELTGRNDRAEQDNRFVSGCVISENDIPASYPAV